MVLRRRAAVEGMALAQAAWTSAWTLALPLTGSSSCASPAAARGVLEVEVLEVEVVPRGEAKVEQVGEEAEEVEVGMVGSRREGREEGGREEEEHVVEEGREGVQPLGRTREEAGGKVDWWSWHTVVKHILSPRSSSTLNMNGTNNFFLCALIAKLRQYQSEDRRHEQ